jgi:hypothetical protein
MPVAKAEFFRVLYLAKVKIVVFLWHCGEGVKEG